VYVGHNIATPTSNAVRRRNGDSSSKSGTLIPKKYQVVKSGVRVLCNDENARIEFEAKALSERLDEGFLIQRTGIATVRRLPAESKT